MRKLIASILVVAAMACQSFAGEATATLSYGQGQGYWSSSGNHSDTYSAEDQYVLLMFQSIDYSFVNNSSETVVGVRQVIVRDMHENIVSVDTASYTLAPGDSASVYGQYVSFTGDQDYACDNLWTSIDVVVYFNGGPDECTMYFGWSQQ